MRTTTTTTKNVTYQIYIDLWTDRTENKKKIEIEIKKVTRTTQFM